MIRPQQRQSIVWLVRILTFISLAMVVTTTALVGWTLAAMRRERGQATLEQNRLNDAGRQLRERAIEYRVSIRASLDETAVWQSQEHSAGAKFAELIASQLKSPVNPAVVPSLVELRAHSDGLSQIEQRAIEWRTSYLAVWEDLCTQRTMNRVRQLIGQLRTEMETLEGRRRLENAIAHKRWRRASGAEAARQAQAILLEIGREESEGDLEFGGQLAELARLVELLGGEEQYDNLTDLKDNKLKPVLDRLSGAVAGIAEREAGSETLNARVVEDLKIALFGEGYRVDGAHQDIVVGHGGLFTLRRDALQLRREREKLKTTLAALAQEVEAANTRLANSTQLRTAELTRQMERSLAAGWNHMLLFGCGCVVLFLWLAWRITRGIDGQVHAIEQARAEAEESRRTTQKLMIEQQQATENLARTHGDLQASERRFRTLSASAPIGIFLADADGNALYLNEHWLGIVDRSLEECLGEGWRKAVHPDDEEEVFAAWKEAALARQAFSREFRFRTPAGEVRWVSSNAVTISSEVDEHIGYVGTTKNITTRKAAEAELEAMQRKLLETSRQAGMAEVATSVLHNVGNVLNSVNVASACVADGLRKSKVSSLTRVVEMLREHETDLGAFFTNDPRARQLPGFLAQLADRLATERTTAIEELGHLQENIEHIKQIVAMQQSYAKVSGVTETVQIADLVEDTLRINAESFVHHHLRVVRDFADVPPVTVEKHKVLQILVNLVRNAKHACDDKGDPDKTVTVRVFNGDGRVKVSVSDNGVGIPPENLSRIFNHGFTTKKNGHGFGLHSGALAAQELGGALRVASEGVGQGATFTLELPAQAAT